MNDRDGSPKSQEPVAPADTKEITLEDTLTGHWLKVPLQAMQECGPAAQTLAGIYVLTNSCTFRQQSEVASESRLSIATCRKHLVTLEQHGWIRNEGRGHTAKGRPRRTATIRLRSKAKTAREPYGMLPWWATCTFRNGRKFKWCSRALLAMWMAELAKIRSAWMNDDPSGRSFVEYVYEDSTWRWRMSLDTIQARTGLTRPSVITAKKQLAAAGVIDWQGSYSADILAPNLDFRVLETPAGPGQCYLDFRGGQRRQSGRGKNLGTKG